jgi:Big-like domain-containing protein
LELSAPAAAPGGIVGYAVTNAGDVPIMLGEAYELERLSNGEWERVELPYAFRLWGRRVESGDRYELSARVPDLAQPGRYRLRKRLDADRDPRPGYEWVAGQEIQPIEVTAEFNVAAD